MSIDSFRTWYEKEGKDMLPIKESLEVAWLNGEHTVKMENTCKNCRYSEQIDNTEYTCREDVKEHCYKSTNNEHFGCNKYNL